MAPKACPSRLIEAPLGPFAGARPSGDSTLQKLRTLFSCTLPLITHQTFKDSSAPAVMSSSRGVQTTPQMAPSCALRCSKVTRDYHQMRTPGGVFCVQYVPLYIPRRGGLSRRRASKCVDFSERCSVATRRPSPSAMDIIGHTIDSPRFYCC